MTARAKKLVSKSIGPGGWGCPCCAPAPGTPKRKELYKRARHKDDKMAILEGLEETEEEACLSISEEEIDDSQRKTDNCDCALNSSKEI